MSQTQKRKGRRGSRRQRSVVLRASCSGCQALAIACASELDDQVATLHLSAHGTELNVFTQEHAVSRGAKVESPFTAHCLFSGTIRPTGLKFEVLSEISIERRILDFMTMSSRTARHAVRTGFPVRYNFFLACAVVRSSSKHSVLSGTGVHVSASSLQERRVPPTETARRESVKFPPPGEALGAVTSLDTFC